MATSSDRFNISTDTLSLLAFTFSFVTFIRYLHPCGQYLTLISLIERIRDRWVSYGEMGLLPPDVCHDIYLDVLERLEDSTRGLVFISNGYGFRCYFRSWSKVYQLMMLKYRARHFYVALLTACEDNRRLRIKGVLTSKDLHELRGQCQQLIAPFVHLPEVRARRCSSESPDQEEKDVQKITQFPSEAPTGISTAVAKFSAQPGLNKGAFGRQARSSTCNSFTSTLDVGDSDEGSPHCRKFSRLGAIFSFHSRPRKPSKEPTTSLASLMDNQHYQV
ncbi:hypothetical protein CPB83DRAFT_846572 [Crepidotus variabilis]|uniref:Uncharacterized protein n=1 Tax=Crepidotus variabilis TaxID=179855 RepID=A0A9P6EPW1_9AGAR|nr:hypothetical protein CPB83DRAFT_846572 [Crepidotus variabilis]